MLARASRVSRVSRVSRASHASRVSRASIDAASERKSRVSAIFQRAVGRLRLIRQFLGVRFKLTRNGDGTVRSACLGAGYQNFAKPVT